MNSEHRQWQLISTGLAVVLLLLLGYIAFENIQKVRKVSTGANAVSNTSDLVAEYTASKFKTVAIIPNPFGTYPNSKFLYVVTTRDINDYSCGSMYGPPKCYFFVEGTASGQLPITFVGTWGQGTGIDSKSIIFINENIVEFDSEVDDAGVGVKERWSLHLLTGSTTLISKQTTE